MIQKLAIENAHAAALARWQTPFPGFASGHDPRSSDNALLALLYGGLVHAAGHEWLNAGRRLIDRTYIEILWQVQALTKLRTCRPEQVSAALDNFIQGSLSQHWDSLPTLDPVTKRELAEAWVDRIATTCFGSLRSEAAASRLLFYLCPMLPVFNLSRGHLLALEQLGHAVADDSYASYARSAQAAFRELAPMLGSIPAPASDHGTPAQQTLIRDLLDDSDWWSRRLFDELMRQGVTGIGDAAHQLFACDDAGGLAPSPARSRPAEDGS